MFVVVVQMISLFGGNSSKSLYPLISEKRMSFFDRNLFSVLIQDLVFWFFLLVFFLVSFPFVNPDPLSLVLYTSLSVKGRGLFFKLVNHSFILGVN